jgi:hypothetical protein
VSPDPASRTATGPPPATLTVADHTVPKATSTVFAGHHRHHAREQAAVGRPLAAAGCRRRAGGCRCRRHRRRRHATHPRPDGALPRTLRGRDRLLRGAPQSVQRRLCLRRAICGRPEVTARPGLPGALTDQSSKLRRLLLSRRYADLDSLTLATSRSHGGIPAGGKETRPWSRAVRCSAVPEILRSFWEERGLRVETPFQATSRIRQAAAGC